LVGHTFTQSPHPTQEFDSTKIALLDIAKSEITIMIIAIIINLVFIFPHTFHNQLDRVFLLSNKNNMSFKATMFYFVKPSYY